MAEAKLGKAANSREANEASNRIGRIRDLYTRIHFDEQRLDVENTIQITAETAEQGTGKYSVCVVHVRGEMFGSYGAGKAGQKTSMQMYDYYITIWDTDETIDELRDEWKSKYNYGYCTKVINAVPRVVRYSQIDIVDQRELSKAAAELIAKTARQTFEKHAYTTYRATNYGPNNNLWVPFVLPADMSSYPSCQ